MPHLSDRIETVIGLDVSKTTVTLHDLTTGTGATIANTLEALIEALTPHAGCDLAVCEATGGYEDPVLAAGLVLDIPLHRGDGGRISAFARSLQRAKTDRIDARTLALYGRERGVDLARYAPPAGLQVRFTALVRHRMDLVEARKITRTRMKSPRAQHVAAYTQRELAFLDREIAAIEDDIARTLTADPALGRKSDILRAIPGVGPAVAAALVALLPELGSTTRKRAASLAGVAPHPRDSGKTSRHRTTTGGRREIRPILFVAALTAARGDNVLAVFYRRLITAGKSKRLALVAVMRKIVVIANARLASAN